MAIGVVAHYTDAPGKAFRYERLGSPRQRRPMMDYTDARNFS
jgi:hypothetical protein